MEFKKIGVLTSGGDAPGMNAVVRAVGRAASKAGVSTVGIMEGYQGLMDGGEKNIINLSTGDVSNVIAKGGTMLYSARAVDFKTEEGMQKALKTIKDNGIDGIVAIGGDGTFRGATKLTLNGVPCIGIPATIDNDITSTENTIGFDTAMNTVIDLVDKLRDTCESHARCSVIEVMGRGAGDIALSSAIASGASGVVIPEVPFDENELIERIERARALGKRNFLVLVSEGVGSEYGPILTEKIEKKTGVESRFARLAHIVRGGTPTLRDRVMASMMGAYAVEKLLAGESNLVVCEKVGKVEGIDINFALKLDGMYKGTLEDGDLDEFTAEDIKIMKYLANKRREDILELYDLTRKINL